jgi:glutathione S-transferase
MNTAVAEALELRITRFIRAPRERVFDAFVNVEQMRQWHCPRGMHVVAAVADARAGGDWRIEMASGEGTRFVVAGRYREVRRPERLAYSWQWQGGGPMPDVETEIEVVFAERNGGTELRMTHRGFPNEAMRDAHTHGWGSCFNRLTDLLDARGSAASCTLLGDARSSYTRSARIGFAEKGVAYTLDPCPPHSPAVDAIHPFGRIPALRDGDVEVWETAAILRYLDESFDGPPLTPPTIAERVRSEQWVSAVNSYLYDTMVRRYVLAYLFPKGADGQPDRGTIDAACKEMRPQIRALDRAWQKSDYLGGGQALSFADLFVAPILAYVERMPEGASLLADAPHLRRAQAAFRQRPSFVSTEPPASGG